MPTTFTMLTQGYATERVAGTVSLILSDSRVIIVDPGMVSDRALITNPLAAQGIEPGDVTDILLSHHHPDHTMNIALFPNAQVHDFMATYFGDTWTDHDEGDFRLTPTVGTMSTPGHSAEDISTVVQTDLGLIVLTHLWWSMNGPELDPFSSDQDVLRSSRESVLQLQPQLIVPGHGGPFTPAELDYQPSP